MKKLLVILMTIFSLAAVASGKSHDVFGTMYYARTGDHTASGDRIVPTKVKSGEHRWVALSLDLYRAGYRFGDTIIVTSETNPYMNGYWVVKDKMAGRKKIDFLVHRSDARKFRNGRVTIRKADDSDLMEVKSGELIVKNDD